MAEMTRGTKFIRMLLQALTLSVATKAESIPSALLAFGATVQFDSAKKGCPKAAQETGGIETDFAHSAQLKFLTYDLTDPRSWAALNGLKQCLESATVPNTKLNQWKGQENVYKVLEATRANMVAQPQWLEHNPTVASKTVLALHPEVSAPMSFVTPDYVLWQPCNALSNAAFYEISMLVCNFQGSFPEPQGWTWKEELIAAANGMAFGSFAMHSGSTPVAAGKYDTGAHDLISMNQMFYLVHQAIVRSLAASADNDANLESILRFGSLTADIPGFSFGDAKLTVQAWAKLMESDGAYWDKHQASVVASTPGYTTSVIGIVLVYVRTVVHPELFGVDAANKAFTGICSGLVDMMMAGKPEGPMVKAAFCEPTSAFAIALFATNWKCAKDIGVSFGWLAETMELFMEAFYWQETKAQPAGWMDQWKRSGLLNSTITECWKVPHANWHRVAAQLVKKLLFLVLYELPTLYFETTPLTLEQKNAAWNNPLVASTNFAFLLRTKDVMSAADKIDMCKILARVKAGATIAGGLPLDPPKNLVNIPALTKELTGMLAKHDPLVNPVKGDGEFKEPIGTCRYTFEFNVDKVLGLSCLKPAIALDFKYVEALGTPVIEAKVSLGLPAQSILTKATVTLKRNKCGILPKTTFPGNIEVRVKVGVDAQVQANVKLDQMFSDFDSAVEILFNTLKLNCKELEISVMNLKGLELLSATAQGLANAALSTSLKQDLCDAVSKEVLPQVEKVVRDEMAKAGLRPGGGERRLSQHSSSQDTEVTEAGQGGQSLRSRNLVAFPHKEFWCDNTDPSLIFQQALVANARPAYQPLSLFLLLTVCTLCEFLG